MTRYARTYTRTVGTIQTERYLAVLRNPTNYRLGLPTYWLRVFDVAAELNKAVENRGLPRSARFKHGPAETRQNRRGRISLEPILTAPHT